MNRIEKSEINWFPEVIEAGPAIRLYFDSLTGELHPFRSVEDDKTNIHDSPCNPDSVVQEAVESK